MANYLTKLDMPSVLMIIYIKNAGIHILSANQ